MRLLLSLLFAFITAAAAFPQLHSLDARKDKNGTANAGGHHKNGTMSNSIAKECKQMDKMMALTKLAGNQTKLDDLVKKGKLNDAQVQALKDKAANVTTTLKTLQANTTLVDECNTFNANWAVKAQCMEMKKLTKWAALSKNQTAVDDLLAKKKLNGTEATKFKDQISKSQSKLQEMQSNSTLTGLCAKQKQEKGSDNSGASGSASPAKESTSESSTLMLQTASYAFLPAIAGSLALFL